MEAAERRAALRAALNAVERAGLLMETPRPDHLDESSRLLDQTCRNLAALTGSHVGCKGDPDLLATATHLRQQIGWTAALLQRAADFHSGWKAVKGSLTAGYGRDGQAADLAASPTVYTRG